ncbi:hypothetical protein [Cryobacterium zhongshanensis]|uniref:Uncharacterized protein n=1 Tax=Cryobacterium zhongshanensis TaxID=2928153 RepID=A0AA41QZG4_9MICO|nr:hypothetical protein [Cryobacterium zhongshanensis]MCI4659718.1 hypothetical protein [Cryobacterium zhongshanensis]
MSESTLSFEAELQQMLDLDVPSNTIIESELGIGTFGLLKQTLESMNAGVYVLGADLGDELLRARPAETFVVPEELLGADTLIVHDAVAMDTDLHERIQEVTQQRSIHGEPLPNLKRVILIYPDWGQDGRRFFMDLGTHYASVRITRTAPDYSVVEADLGVLRDRRRARSTLASDHRSALTLKPGDELTIPGIGTKRIGAVNQLDFDRYQIRLDGKFVESVVVEVSVPSGEQRTPERHESRSGREDRSESRDVAHLKEDLEASLKFALGDDYANRVADAQAIIDGLEEYRDTSDALRAVQARFGNLMFGKVTLYHLENGTALSRDAEVVTFTRSLKRLGMTVADLGWPDEALNSVYLSRE